MARSASHCDAHAKHCLRPRHSRHSKHTKAGPAHPRQALSRACLSMQSVAVDSDMRTTQPRATSTKRKADRSVGLCTASGAQSPALGAGKAYYYVHATAIWLKQKPPRQQGSAMEMAAICMSCSGVVAENGACIPTQPTSAVSYYVCRYYVGRLYHGREFRVHGM